MKRCRKVLEKCREIGITISEKKLTIGTKVKFAGYIVSAEGVSPDPEKVESLRNFPVPEDLTSLRSFLGLANQLGGFMPDLSQIVVNIRSLMKKNTKFLWTPEIL